jgi:hypothetical protein
MQGDYRFSFILPVREEMLRKVPRVVRAEPIERVPAESDSPALTAGLALPAGERP